MIGQSSDPDSRNLTVYVPRPGSELRESIWNGSGIVGSAVGTTGRVRIDFEGDAEIYSAFGERVRRAADRHRWAEGERDGYPTRACGYCSPDELIAVGSYDPHEATLRIEDPDSLREWLPDDEPVPDSGPVG